MLCAIFILLLLIDYVIKLTSSIMLYIIGLLVQLFMILKENTMPATTIYHNPRCSKSRQTLEIIQGRGVEPEIVLYLEQTPTTDQLSAIISKLGITPRQLLRKGEDAFKENNLKDDSLSDAQLIAAMVQFPKLIERPIVVVGNKAVLGRPPENVLTLIG
jgi:arsenate reductase